VVSVNKYLQKLHTPLDGAGEMREEGAEEANDTEVVGWRKGSRAVYKRNKYIAGERECRHNLSLEYGSGPD